MKKENEQIETKEEMNKKDEKGDKKRTANQHSLSAMRTLTRGAVVGLNGLEPSTFTMST